MLSLAPPYPETTVILRIKFHARDVSPFFKLLIAFLKASFELSLFSATGDLSLDLF